MSFHIYVTIPHEEIPVPDDPGTLTEWIEESNKYSLFSQPLGADDTVYKNWSDFAFLIGLPIITDITSVGFLFKTPKNWIDLKKNYLN